MSINNEFDPIGGDGVSASPDAVPQEAGPRLEAKRAESDKREPSPLVMGQPDAMVCIDKQRNGSVEGKFGLAFDHRSLRFCDSENAPVDPYPMEFA